MKISWHLSVAPPLDFHAAEHFGFTGVKGDDFLSPTGNLPDDDSKDSKSSVDLSATQQGQKETKKTTFNNSLVPSFLKTGKK